jgi:hypothetical protein
MRENMRKRIKIRECNHLSEKKFLFYATRNSLTNIVKGNMYSNMEWPTVFLMSSYWVQHPLPQACILHSDALYTFTANLLHREKKD